MMKPKLSSNVILRVDEELKGRLARMQKKSGCAISEIMRQCLISLVEHYEANNSITLPVVVIPEKDLLQLTKAARKSPTR